MSSETAVTSLANFTSSAQEELSSLWSGAGLPAAEAQELTEKLIADLREVVTTTVKSEQERLETMRAELPGMRAELAATREVLGGDVRTVPGEDTGDLLVPTYRTLLDARNHARILKSERLEARKAKEQALAAARAELDGSEGPAADAPAPPAEPTEDAPNGLSLALLGRLQARVDAAMDERASRVKQLEALQGEAAGLRKTLGYPAESAVHPEPLSRAALADAERGLADLKAEKQRREDVLNDCSEYIQELLAKCQVAGEELPKAEEAGLSQAVLTAYHAEIERLEKIKAEKIGPLLAAARARLPVLWQKLYMSAEETAPFRAAWENEGAAEGAPADEAETERLEEELEAVEQEEARLSAKLEATAKVYGLFTKRVELLEKRAELQAKDADPSRTVPKGLALIEETKLRTRIKELPNMNKKLRELAAEWSRGAGNGDVLTAYGRPIVEVLAEQEKADEEAKQEEAEERRRQKESARNGGAAAPAAKSAPRNSARGPGPAANQPGATKTAGAPAAASKKDSTAPAPRPSAPPPPPPPPPPAAPPPAHAVPSERILQTLNSDTPFTPSPSKAGALAAPPPVAPEKENPSIC